MATYLEIYDLKNDGAFLHQIAVALAHAFRDVKGEDSLEKDGNDILRSPSVCNI